VESQCSRRDQRGIAPRLSDVAVTFAEQQPLDPFHSDNVGTAKEEKQRSLARHTPVGAQLRAIFFSNRAAMILIPCIPAGFVVNYAHSNSITAFCINFAAIAPSAAVLSVATNDLKIRSGEKISALLNQTFG
jgi:Ca2+:H+ antiporter